MGLVSNPGFVSVHRKESMLYSSAWAVHGLCMGCAWAVHGLVFVQAWCDTRMQSTRSAHFASTAL
jgi:hypothetical protein